ncbi:hypothetical protein LUZ60_002901 [Juncus effusus]|nr:hypothetical protein LUZ60_002901 [Juncus effusus]
MDSFTTEFPQNTSKLNNSRSPLLPSEKNKYNTSSARQIASRYKSNSPNKRYPSPNVAHSSPSMGSTLPKRAQSAERRRSVLPSSPSSSSSSCSSSSSGPNTPLADTLMVTRNRELQSRQYSMWPSMRSLSSAFQSERISIPVTNKSKTPLKGRTSVSDQTENSSPRAARWQPSIGGKVPVAKTVGTKTKKVVPLPSLVPTKVVPVPVSKVSQSPARVRATPVQPAINAVGFIADLKKGKRKPSQIEDAYKLRIVYNKLLQWRFVNSRNTEALSVQKENSEEMLYSAWNVITELRESVVTKRLDLQELRREEQMNFLLNDQILYLEEWADLEREHSVSLSRSIGALKSSTLRVPVTAGTKADLHGVKNAVSSAVDVMQAMGSSVCSLIEKVEDRRSLVSELSNVVIQENRMLEDYRELLSMAAQLQVKETSLRTQLLQLR